MTPRQPQSDTPRVSEERLLEIAPDTGACGEYKLGEPHSLAYDLRDARAALQASLQRVAEVEAALVALDSELRKHTTPMYTGALAFVVERARLAREGVRST